MNIELLFSTLFIKQSESRNHTCKIRISEGVLEEVVDLQPGLSESG